MYLQKVISKKTYPGSWFLTIPDLGSRIQQQQFVVLPYSVDANSQYWKLLYFWTGTEKNVNRLTKKYIMYFHPKILSLISEKYGMGIRDLGKPLPDPGVKKGTGSRIRDLQHCCKSAANQVMNCLPTVAGGSVADLDPGSGIGFFRIPDLGSRIPRPYF